MPHPTRSIGLACAIVFAFGLIVRGDVTQRQYLSGTDKDHTVAWQFYCDRGQNSGKWSTIAVPSNWELQGFGVYTYGNAVTAAIRAVPRGGSPADRAAAEPGVHGKYKVNFNVPAEWAGKRVFLVFDGAMTDTEAFVNGQSAGPIHRGGYYRFKYDVTQLVKLGGDNLLEANVTDVSSDPSVNNAERHADYWNYGGIFRPVYLEAVPTDYLDHIATNAAADGSIEVDAYAGDSTKNADRVEAQVLNRDGTNFGAAFSAKFDAAAPVVTLKSKLDGVKQWSAETPNLYDVRVRLMQGDKVLHETTERIGFRTIEVRVGDGVYVNGQRVMLKGCCRHTFWPDSGRTTSPEVSELDVNTIKDMNMNAVRLTHYPTDPSFLEKCDELGLYVLDELGGWHGHYDTPVGKELVKAMVIRDENHPCVLFWDNGNEGGWNNDLNGEFDKYDPENRHVLHPWILFGGINTKHYPNVALMKKLAEGPDVFMPTEFNHGMYDGGAGAELATMWDIMKHSKFSAGGFIWAYLDEGVRRTDKGNILDTSTNEAPDGILGPYREKEASFYTIKQIWSAIQIDAPKLGADFDQTLNVHNYYDFTNLSECKLTWQLRKFPAMNETAKDFSVASQGEIAATDIAPHGAGNVKLNLPADWSSADALAVTATDPHGREVWTWVWPISEAARNPTIAPVAVGDIAGAGSGSQLVVLSGGGTVVSIDKTTGQIASVQSNGHDISFKNGPRPVEGEAKVAGFAQPSPNVVEVKYSSGLKSVRWTMDATGRLRLEYQYEAGGAIPYAGVTFDYPEANVKSKRWLGPGPFRVYANRLEGGTLNVWQNDYNDSVTGQTWQYPEFKGYFLGVRWMKLETSEGAITIAPHSNDLFLRVLTPTYPDPKLALATKVAFPPGNISILDRIPPVGAKQVKPATQPAMAEGTYGATVDFYFGENK
jgi:hypothetical protein